MVPRTIREYTLKLEKIVGGGQALGVLDDGRKAFVWGGLPGETVTIRETNHKSNYIEGVVIDVQNASPERIEPLDPASYLSTSPWQIMTFEAEQRYKAALILEAFEMHGVQLPDVIDVFSNNITARYRNKVEFSWYSDTDATGSVETLDIAFFRRGSKGKIVVEDVSLLPESMMRLAHTIRDFLRAKHVTARQLKTLLIRCDQSGNCAWQLYIKDQTCDFMSEKDAEQFNAQGGEVIYSDPRSPASRITKRLLSVGNPVLSDTVLGVPFRYATEGFFQVNIPVYEQALRDMREWVPTSANRDDIDNHQTNGHSDFPSEVGQDNFVTSDRPYDRGMMGGDSIEAQKPDLRSGAKPSEESVSSDANKNTQQPMTTNGKTMRVLDLYSGVGSIGLTIGGDNCTLIEIDEHAVREMKRNITKLHSNAKAVLAPAEKALEYITEDATIIVDPPRAGLHASVTAKLLEAAPPRIIYLSCNPVTQARDVALLAEKYKVVHHRGYNFFPRTPHIEHLVVLDLV